MKLVIIFGVLGLLVIAAISFIEHRNKKKTDIRYGADFKAGQKWRKKQ